MVWATNKNKACRACGFVEIFYFIFLFFNADIKKQMGWEKDRKTNKCVEWTSTTEKGNLIRFGRKWVKKKKMF